jgi:hypothetical protein
MTDWSGYGSLIGGVGGLVSGLSSAFGARNANKDRRNAMIDQTELALQTADKWKSAEVRGLKKAGLNPVLAATGGGGGSSPGFGGMYQPENAMGDAVSSAKASIEGILAKATVKNINEDTAKKKTEQELMRTHAGLLASTARGVNYENIIKSYDAKWAETLGGSLNAGKTVGSVLGNVGRYLNPKNLLIPFKKKRKKK